MEAMEQTYRRHKYNILKWYKINTKKTKCENISILALIEKILSFDCQERQVEAFRFLYLPVWHVFSLSSVMAAYDTWYSLQCTNAFAFYFIDQGHFLPP